MYTTDDISTDGFDFIELDAAPTKAPQAPKSDAKPKSLAETQKETAAKVAAGELSFKEVEGKMSVSETLAFRPAADALARDVPVHINESTENAAERAVLKILGLDDKGKRIKGKGEKNLDLKGLLGEGERILDSAVRRKWEKQPFVSDIATKVAKQIADEHRQTLPVVTNKLYLGKEGSLYLQGRDVSPQDGNIPHRLSGTAYSQIADRAPGINKPLAYNLNAWTSSVDKAVRLRRLADKSYQEGKEKRPLVFAAVGPKYVEFDADKAVGALAGRLGPDARGRWTYHGDGGLWKLEASLARPRDVEGDLHEMGLWLKSSDDGRAGVNFGFAATRWTCSNTLRILHAATVKSMRHVGSIERFLERFNEILAMAEDAWKLFETVWGAARTSHPIDAETGKGISVEDAVIRLVAAKSTDKYRLSVPGVDREVLAGRILTSWSVEPDDSVQGLVNAITRASHEWKWEPSKWCDEELEEQAAQLLYAKVIELPPMAVTGADPSTLIELS